MHSDAPTTAVQAAAQILTFSERSRALVSDADKLRDGQRDAQTKLKKQTRKVEAAVSTISGLRAELEALRDGEHEQLSRLQAELAREKTAALEHAGRPPLEVLAAAKSGLEDFPTSPDLWFLAAGALAAAGHLDEALKCLQRTLTSMEGAEQLAVRHLTGAWQVYHRVGDLLADAGNMADAYRAYLTAIAERPVTRPQWPVLLNVAIGLGIDLKDHDRVPGLIDDLLDCPTAPLDLFAVWLGRVEAADGIDAARARLAEATKRTPRLDGAEGFEQWR